METDEAKLAARLANFPECSRCGGEGRIRVPDEAHRECCGMYTWEECDDCGGAGYVKPEAKHGD
jgi:DnaJ-class molecular chaperone